MELNRRRPLTSLAPFSLAKPAHLSDINSNFKQIEKQLVSRKMSQILGTTAFLGGLFVTTNIG